MMRNLHVLAWPARPTARRERLLLILCALPLVLSACTRGRDSAPLAAKFTSGGRHGEWAWMGGSNGVDRIGIYGTLGRPSPANVPGARRGAVTWRDSAGNLWLFGGHGYDSAGTVGQLNDLWEYRAGEWTWMGGSQLANQAGIYGTLGTPSAANIPGGRGQAVACTDASGNVWLFGGAGYDAAGTYANLNDLWKYSAGQWTWMGGSESVNQVGNHGTLGTPAPSNIPGARQQAVAWTDASGSFWLFGGDSYDAEGTFYDLNDLWRYREGEWTWMGGSDSPNQVGTYGTLGTPSATNIPGARFAAVAWTDSSGDVWLFGGGGYDSVGTDGLLNDLWKYSQGRWTWMGGSELANQVGTYRTLGKPGRVNIPGARGQAVAWTDASGNFWLFGGQGYPSAPTAGDLNDLWKYSGGEWTWMGGSDLSNRIGTYGTLGTPSRSNVPGARYYRPAAWTDASGNLWLFGGDGYGSTRRSGLLNDLWAYEP